MGTDIPGCLSRCAMPGADVVSDAGDAGGDAPPAPTGSGAAGGPSVPPPGPCVPAGCPDPAFPIGQKCCTADGACGFQVQALGPDCLQANNPGVIDPACPAFSIPVGPGISLAGCCRPDGNCGAMDTFIGFGCADLSAVGGPPPKACNPP